MPDTEVDVDVVHAAWTRFMEMSQEYCESCNTMFKTYPELKKLIGINLAISTPMIANTIKNHVAMQLTMGRSDLIHESLNAIKEIVKE